MINNKLTLTYGARIGLFLCASILCLIFCTLVSGFILYKWGETTLAMRIATIIQDIFVFIAPSLITALLITRLPADFLQLRKMPSIRLVILVTLIIFLSIPIMNFIVYCNESIVFPDDLSWLENAMREAEDKSRKSIEILLGVPTIGNLIISILIVGILTGLSEELFFRGALQNIFYSRPMNAHIAIWISAIIFSAMHFQFYGFIPRTILGAFFGYLALWSGSIWLPIFAHTLNNTFVVISSWLISHNTTNIDINKIGTEYTFENGIFIFTSLVATILCVIIIYRECHKNNKLTS